MKKITDIKEGTLPYIFKKLESLKILEKKIRPYLPEEIRQFCRLANFENGILKFAVPNSVWGTKFRYYSSELLSKLQKEMKLNSIAYYIEPEFNQIFKQN